MKRSMTTLFTTALCGLSLCLVAAPGAHAQGKILFTARTSEEPAIIAVVDRAEESDLDWELAAFGETIYADTVWTIQDDGQITVTNAGKTVLTTRCWYGESKTYFFVHSRSNQDTVDGEIYRFASDPTKGSANLWLTRPSNDGQSWNTINVYVDLTFAAPEPGTNGGKVGGGADRSAVPQRGTNRESPAGGIVIPQSGTNRGPAGSIVIPARSQPGTNGGKLAGGMERSAVPQPGTNEGLTAGVRDGAPQPRPSGGTTAGVRDGARQPRPSGGMTGGVREGARRSGKSEGRAGGSGG